nr:DNA-binding protein [uncultured Pseudogulbenkiania sp.]
MKTPEQVRAEFDLRGVSISSWAKANGYPAALVYQVLRGNKPCRIGMSHEIAVKLGLKAGMLSDTQELSKTLAAETLQTPEVVTF